MHIELTKAQEFITDVIKEAGEILKRYFESQIFTSQTKGGLDFKTQADDEVDQLLRDRIQKEYPYTEFLTEETAPKDFISFKEKNNVWIIDPIDGTNNFSRGIPHFSISVALVSKGVTQLGTVYLPEENELYIARVDEEHATLNGNVISVAKTKELGESTIATDWAWDIEKRKDSVRVISLLSPHVRGVKCMGTAAGDLGYLASGRIDAYISFGLKPWDIAASSLFVEKAGGRITTPKGEKWDIFNHDILATNDILHQEFLELLNV